ncbi:MAG: 2-oxoacid:acceptor oxidoreductase family protein [Proteobacteria bacterium]|nr:2-oxoacid:acceptor oxidoreductase family protein [Pseudomonadota bacterium]
MTPIELRCCGQGGQGVIMTGMVVGKAAAIYEDRHATLVQSFGPEARGSTCSAQVMISDAPVPFPYVRHADILVAFSQSAYDKFVAELKPGATLIYESDLLSLDNRLPQGVVARGIGATRIATEALGRRIVANMVMLGFLVKQTGIVSKDAAIEALRTLVPPGTSAFNIKAFETGYQQPPV